MIACSRAVIRPGGRLAELSCQPPLTLRQVTAADREVCALCLVNSAAGPLAGDDLTLTLEVADGASAVLQAAGAQIAQGRGGDSGSCLRFQADVGAGGKLRADPGALIIRPGGRADARVNLRLAADATVDWRELIVLHRGGSASAGPAGGAGPASSKAGETAGEAAGWADGQAAAGAAGSAAGSADGQAAGEAAPAVTLRWDVTRDGRPMLRQLVDLTDPHWQRWPGLVAGRRVLASALLAGPGLAARTIVATPNAVAQELDDTAVLVTVLADDAAAAQRQRDELCAGLLGTRR